MTNLRRKILDEIYDLEYTYCSTCPLNNLSMNCADEQKKAKQRNYKHCKGCPIFDSIREKGEQLNSLSKRVHLIRYENVIWKIHLSIFNIRSTQSQM